MFSKTATLPLGVDLSEDGSPSVTRSAIASMILCMLFYLLRISSRWVAKTSLMASDYVLFGGVLACYVISSVDLWAIRLGLGKHIEVVAVTDPSLSQVVAMLKCLMVNDCFYAFGQVTVKISLLLLYRHLFVSKQLHLLINVVGAFTLAWGVAFIGVSIFSCIPIRAFWDFQMQAQSYCINNRKFYVAMAVPNILADILILCMPIRQVWKLQLDRRSKVVLTFIFLLGTFVCIASVIRVTTLFGIDNADPTYTLVGIANWSSLEFALAVVSASLPTLRPLVSKLVPSPKKKGAVKAFSRSIVTIGGSERYSNSRKERHLGHGTGDEFQRLPTDTGREVFAFHQTPDDLELGEHNPTKRDGIMVTSLFSTTSSR